MNIQRTRFLRGPNVYAAVPVLEFVLDVVESPAEAAACTRKRVLQALAISGSSDNVNHPSAFAEVMLQLLCRANVPGSFREVRTTRKANRFLVAVECEIEIVGLAAAQLAIRLFNDATKGDIELASEEMKRVADIEYNQRLPSSTAVIYHAARKRGIPSRRLSSEYFRLLIHGQGCKQHRSLAAEPDSISIVARTSSTDKQLTKELLAAAGVPVPLGRVVTNVEDAWKAAQELGMPVAIKPLDADLQVGVSLDIRTREQVEAAFRHAVKEHGGEDVIVERFAPGFEHRVLMVDGKVAAVTRIDPPHVYGDGTKTVAQLVDGVNSDPRRGDENSDLPWHKIVVDDVARQVVKGQGYEMSSVPPKGERVLLRRNPPYFAAGGNFIDQTDEIHPSVVAHAAAACDALQVSVGGLDIVALDITKPLEPQGGAVIEVNVGPGLWLHLAPAAEHPRPVGEAILASMYPPGEDGRIPVVALVGRGEAASSTNRFLREMLVLDGLRVGHAGPGESGANGRLWPSLADPHARAKHILQHTKIDLAILETTPEELVQHGFGNDRCDLAISLAVEPPSSIDDVAAEAGDYLKSIRHSLVKKGTMVAIAQDEAVVKTQVSPAELFLVAQSADRTEGRRAITTDHDNNIIVTDHSGKPTSIGKAPAGLSEGTRQCLLASLAGAIAMGIHPASLQGYLSSLRRGSEKHGG